VTLTIAPIDINKSHLLGIPRGAKVDLLEQSPGRTPCRLSQSPWLLLEREPTVVINLPKLRAEEIPVLTKALTTHHLALVKVAQGQAAPVCRDKPRITYGTGN
jgi:hypothetical protein